MTVAAVAATAAACAASAVLLCAGAAKHAVPGPARQAVSGLAPRLERAAAALVRSVATIELLTALGLLIPAVRPAASVALAALGAGFAAVGAAGMAAREQIPCGCFGSAAGRPFGLRNVAVGVALVAVAVLVMLVHPTSVAVAPTVTAVLTVGLCAWLYRDLIVAVVVAARKAARSAETSGAH